jgi:murein DD-endopeptidase MepM/ murein hydrolase activator NlpD
MLKLPILVFSSLLFLLGIQDINLFGGKNKTNQPYQPVEILPCNESVYLFGIRVDTLTIGFENTLKKQKLKEVLKLNNFNAIVSDKITNKSRIYLNPQKLQEGNRYLTFKDKNERVVFLAYKLLPGKYIIIENTDSATVRIDSVPVTIENRKICGIIQGSLDKTLDYLDIPKSLKKQLGEIYATAFDFYKLKEGDTIKLIYQERYESLELPTPIKITACEIKQKQQSYFAIAYNYNKDTLTQYFDQEAQNLKRCFLEMPLMFGRVASKYNLNRFHPVLHVNKAHLGTDYAAPYNTPILATAPGTIIEATYKANNGNYVKILHDKTYTTQYLHMCRIGKDIKKGKKVKQGDVIGFVGATGLATGPHVCYRFWKNGKQVDPYRENLKFVKPTDSIFVKQYRVYFDSLQNILNQIKPLSKDKLPS